MSHHTKAIVDARARGFLICLDSWHAVERAWRKECDASGIPAAAVFYRRGHANFYIDPVRPMRQQVVELLHPLFLEAVRRVKCASFVCGAGFCSINLPRAEALSLAAKASLIVRNIHDVCPSARLPAEDSCAAARRLPSVRNAT